MESGIFYAHYRTESGEGRAVQLHATTAKGAISEGKALCERIRAGFQGELSPRSRAYQLLEITDESRDGFTVWQSDRFVGVRGWK